MKYCTQCNRAYAGGQTVCPADGNTLRLRDIYGFSERIIADKYLIKELVNIGGMSAIYSAQQIGIGRNVAFKILLPNIADSNTHLAQLFEREAKTTGQLSHENIATIFDAGHTPEAVPYMVMEWIDGRTLEVEIKEHAPFTLARTTHLLKQIATALDTAHARRIVHRDLKPSNIMLVNRVNPNGELEDQVKILDFGLAKVLHHTADLKVSEAVGTPNFASPEQFQPGAEIDGRSDIYTLGVIVYQMLTGHLPFYANTITEAIRGHLLERPKSVAHYRQDLPPVIEAAVNRMLAKLPQYRPETAGIVAAVFEQALVNQQRQAAFGGQQAAGTHSPVAERLRGGTAPQADAQQADSHYTLAQLFAPIIAEKDAPELLQVSRPQGNATTSGSATSSKLGPLQQLKEQLYGQRRSSVELKAGSGRLRNWLRYGKYALVLGTLLSLIGLSTGLYLFLHPAPTVLEREGIIVVDFENHTGEQGLTATLKDALNVELAKMPQFDFLPPDRLQKALHHMRREPDEVVTRAIAREIAQRYQVKVIVSGRVDKLANVYSLTLEALHSQTGESLAQGLAQAQGKDQLLRKLAEVTEQVCTQLTRKIVTIKDLELETEQVTTKSFEALKSYTLARNQQRKGAYLEAIALYKRALEMDGEFGMAYYALASSYYELGQTALAAKQLEHTPALLSFLSDRERQEIIAYTSLIGTGVTSKAIEQYKLLQDTFPSIVSPLYLSRAYLELGDLNTAREFATSATQLDADNLFAQELNASMQLRTGQLKELDEWLVKLSERKFPFSAPMLRTQFSLAALLPDSTSARQSSNVPDSVGAMEWLAAAAIFSGKIEQSYKLMQQRIEFLRQQQLFEPAARLALKMALWTSLAGDEAKAKIFLQEAQKLHSDSLFRYSAINVEAFGPFVQAMQPDYHKAEALLRATVEAQPLNQPVALIWAPLTRALLDLRRGHTQRALEQLNRLERYEAASNFYLPWLQGQALRKLQRPTEALNAFHRITSRRYLDTHSFLYPLAVLELARTHAQLGNVDEARKQYAELLSLWRNAEPKLPLLVTAQKEAAALGDGLPAANPLSERDLVFFP